MIEPGIVGGVPRESRHDGCHYQENSYQRFGLHEPIKAGTGSQVVAEP
jgi:hypothetical protein